MGNAGFSELVSSVLGQRCQKSLMFNSYLKSLLKFYCFCEVIFLFHNAIKVSHIKGICELSIRMHPLDLSQTFSIVIWSTGLNLRKNLSVVGTYCVYAHLQSLYYSLKSKIPKKLEYCRSKIEEFKILCILNSHYDFLVLLHLSSKSSSFSKNKIHY